MTIFGRQLVLVCISLSMAVCSASAFEQAELTRQQEQAALKFARKHHAELADLLKQLDQDMTSEYGKAVFQLHQTKERLDRYQTRSEEDYQLQLDAWKVNSRIQLLAARMTMSSDVSLGEEMKSLLIQKHDFKEKLLVREKDRTQTRLERYESQLENLRKSRAELIEKDLARYLRLQPSQTSPASTTKKSTTNKKPSPKSPVQPQN